MTGLFEELSVLIQTEPVALINKTRIPKKIKLSVFFYLDHQYLHHSISLQHAISAKRTFSNVPAEFAVMLFGLKFDKWNAQTRHNLKLVSD